MTWPYINRLKFGFPSCSLVLHSNITISLDPLGNGIVVHGLGDVDVAVGGGEGVLEAGGAVEQKRCLPLLNLPARQPVLVRRERRCALQKWPLSPC
eukprot:4700400-Pyramimonas_sp.AAC.1